MSVHEGHRERLKRRFLQEGLDNFDEIQVLELLLFYAIPRRDTNPLDTVCWTSLVLWPVCWRPRLQRWGRYPGLERMLLHCSSSLPPSAGIT